MLLKYRNSELCLKHFVRGEGASLARAAELPRPRGASERGCCFIGGLGEGFGAVFILFCSGELALPTVLDAESPALALSASPSCWEQPPRYPPVFLSSLRSPFGFGFFVWVWLVGFVVGFVVVFFPPVGCKKKSGLGEKVKQMEPRLSCPVPPLEPEKSPAAPAPSPPSLSQKLQQFALLFAGGRRQEKSPVPLG